MKAALHARKPTVRARQKTALLFVLAFLCGAAYAQDLVIEFEVPHGYRPAFKGSDEELQALLEFQIPEKFDLNGDGNPEILMTRDNAQGVPTELVVVDIVPSPPEVLWTLDLSAYEITNPDFFHGFFDIWADAMGRAAVFGGEAVLIFRPEFGSGVVFSLDADHQLFGVLDIDGDDRAELIIDNKVGGVIQVWGGGAAGSGRAER